MESPKANQIDVQKVQEELRKCPISVIRYVTALEFALERQKDLTKLAISKLRSLKNEDKKD